MEHVGALSRRFGEAQFCVRSQLSPNHLGYDFQPWDVRKKTGGALWMVAKDLILFRREILAPVSLFENLVGQHDATHQAQHGSKFVLPSLLKLQALRDPEYDIPNGMRPQDQHRRCNLD